MAKSERAASWVASLEWEKIPPEVAESVKCQILDVVGVMLAARTEPLVRNISEVLHSEGGQPEASVLGDTRRIPLPSAAMINGVMAGMLEYDDTHTQSAIHSTSCVAAAALPCAQQSGASGKELIAAVLVGNELCCRLGLVSKVRFFDLAIQPTGVFGVFGATYALSKLRKLSVDRMVSAIGICGSMSASRMSSWEDGTSAKSLHQGWVASHAVRAVKLAEKGVSGPAGIFDGRFNLYRSIVQDANAKFELDVIDRELGSHWETLGIASKAYPSGYPIHPYLDAVFHLQKQYSLKADDIGEVKCHISPARIATLCEPRPLTTWHAKVSLQHCAAEAIVTGRADKTSYGQETLHDPVIRSLADRIHCVADAEIGADPARSRAHVVMTLRDGRVISHTVEDMRGTRRNPMTRADFVNKFRSNTSDLLPAKVLDKVIEDLFNLDQINDVRPLFDLIAENVVVP